MEKMKKRLALLLAVLMVFTMSIPTGLVAFAAPGDPGEPGPEDETVVEGNVTSTILPESITGTQGGDAVNGFSEAEGVASVFDSNPDTKYCANTVSGAASPDKPLILTFNLSEAQTINTYSLTSGGDSGDRDYYLRDLESWRLEAYVAPVEEGEGSWVKLDERSHQYFGENSLTKYYQIKDNVTPYTNYRLVVTGTCGGLTIFQLGGLDVYTGTLDEAKDADKISETAAQVVEEQISALPDLDSTEDVMTYQQQVSEARAAYEALTPAVQYYVKNVAILNKWDRAMAAAAVPSLFSGLVDKLYTAYTDNQSDMDEEGNPVPLDYHLAADATYAMILYTSMSSANQSAAQENYTKLQTVIEALDEVTGSYTVQATGWDSADSAQAWVATASEEEQVASQQAAANAVMYTYQKLGMKATTSTSFGLTAEWGDVMMKQFEDGGTYEVDGVTHYDNPASPWGADRHWAYVSIPFIGISFVSTGNFSTHYDYDLARNMPISDAFQYNGYTYQVYMNGYRYYNSTATLTPGENMFTSNSLFPGKHEGADATKNSFRLAYASYVQENRDNYKVLGIPDAEATVTDTVVYQPFIGPSGYTVIAATADNIEAASASDPAAIAFVVEGDVLSAIEDLGTADIGAGLEVSGGPLTAADESGLQLFENGYVESGEYHAYDGSNIDKKLNQYLLPALQAYQETDINADNVAAAQALLEQAQEAYTTLTDKAKAENYTEIVDAVTAKVKKYESDEQAIAELLKVVSGLAAPSDEDGDDVVAQKDAAIKAARQAYNDFAAAHADLLSDSRVSNADSTIASYESGLQAFYDQKAAKEVLDLFSKLPECYPEVISEDDFASVKEQANAAIQAYDKMEESAQRQLAEMDPFAADKIDSYKKMVNYKTWQEWADSFDEVMKGDMNGDGNLGVADVVLLRRAILNNESVEENPAGDMNDDGNLNVADVVLLRREVLN